MGRVEAKCSVFSTEFRPAIQPGVRYIQLYTYSTQAAALHALGADSLGKIEARLQE